MRCTVCTAAERGRAELLLAGGASLSAVAKKFGLPYYPLRRHWLGHVSAERKAQLAFGPVEAAALAARVAEESTSVVDHFRVVRAGLYQLYDAAVTAGDRNAGALLAGRLHENLNAMAKLTGQLAQSPLIQQNTINVFVNDPAFAAFQADLITVLGRFPDARAAVIAAFEKLESAAPAPALPALEHQSAEAAA